MSLYEELKDRLERFENPNEPDSEGQLPLVWACRYGCIESVQILLDHGADPSAMFGRISCLCHCCRFGYHNIMAELLKHGVNPDIPNDDGSTPILDAVALDRRYSLDILLEYAADVYVIDTKGRSLLRIAAENGSFDIALRLIREYGFDPYEVSHIDGKTPIDAAIENGRVHLAEAMRIYSSSMLTSLSFLDENSAFYSGLDCDCFSLIQENLATALNSERSEHYRLTSGVFLFAP